MSSLSLQSEGRSGDDVFVLLGRILAKHLTPEQTARVMLEFRKVRGWCCDLCETCDLCQIM